MPAELAGWKPALYSCPIRTAPLPLFRFRAQASADRVVDRVGHATRMVVVIPYQMVIRFALPELTRTAQHFVGFLRGERFPTVQHAAQRFRRARPDDDMHVIGHDNPRSQFVTLAVKKLQRISHELSDFRLPKETVAVAGVEVSVDAGRIPTEQFLLLLPGERTFGGERVLEDLFAFLLEAAKHLARKRARETESDEIRTAFALQVRQMVARMETRSQMTLRVGCRAGILPAGCSGFQPRVFLRWFHCLRNFGQDARKTGRLEACPTFLR